MHEGSGGGVWEVGFEERGDLGGVGGNGTDDGA
jgi:hypothetical protein